MRHIMWSEPVQCVLFWLAEMAERYRNWYWFKYFVFDPNNDGVMVLVHSDGRYQVGSIISAKAMTRPKHAPLH